jgi:hypothetical protein
LFVVGMQLSGFSTPINAQPPCDPHFVSPFWGMYVV